MCGLLLSWAGKDIAMDIWRGLKRNNIHESSLGLMPQVDDYVKNMSDRILKAYFLNPLVLLTYISGSTSIFQNFFLAGSLYGTVKGSMILSSTFLALIAYQNLYAVPILIPSTLYIITKKHHQQTEIKQSIIWLEVLSNFAVFIAVLGSLIFYSFKMTGTWEFLDATYGFVLKVPDLRPNIGLFWYFFIEMFEHFESFFLCVFQINAIVYVLPLTMRFYRDPPLLIYIVISLLAIYKSYPSIADVGFYMSLLPLWRFTFKHTRYSFTVVCMFVASCVLGPILWHLWIYSGSANANFFFAMTLVFNAAQIFLLTDIVFGKMKHDFLLENGIDLKIDGKDATLDME
ncbi:hypothetical protein QYM36_009783 [Artemia franciscana]|nr:hypothetical protein QYM36_009783 [Artemia franciscana]